MNTKWRPVTQFDAQGEAHHYVDTVGGDTIASCFTESDARLIAAAPEMLEALHKAQERISQLCETVNALAGFRKVRAYDFTEEVRAAIIKAT